MALTYVQDLHYLEADNPNIFRVRFVVSDDYNSLFDEVIANTTDIFQLESVSQELNIDEGSFAVDSLDLTVDGASCRNETDNDALFFLLGASDITQKRFCAVFFNPTFSDGKADIESVLFSGKILPNITGDDLLWRGASYAQHIDPLTIWKFQALSFDVSVLATVKLADIYDELTNIEIDQLFEHKPLYFYDPEYFENKPEGKKEYELMVSNLGKLYDCLQLILNKAVVMVGADIGVPDMEFELVSSPLGYDVCPVIYETKHNAGEDVTFVNKATPFPSVRQPISISPIDSEAVWIHKKVFRPEGEIEKEYSFLKFETVEELLYAVARSFGVYLRFKYITAKHVQLEFISRSALLENEDTFLRDSDKASLTLSNSKSETEQKYTARSSNLALDGEDTFHYREQEFPLGLKLAPSDRLENLRDSTKDLKNGEKKVDETRVLFSHSWTLQQVNVDNEYRFRRVPQNTIYKYYNRTRQGTYTENAVVSYIDYNIPGRASEEYSLQEVIHTAVYIKTQPLNNIDVERMHGKTHVWRPASHIFARINDRDEVFETLPDYLNAIAGRESIFYESEYQIGAGFWSGFSKSADGTNPSWRNIRLGSKIPFSRAGKTWDGEEWTSGTAFKRYVCVGIKWNLKSPGAELKLHEVSRFAYSEFQTFIASPPDEEPSPSFVASPTSAKFETVLEDITKAHAIAITQDGIVKAQAIAAHYGVIGIAQNDALIGDLCFFQENGVVVSSLYDFTPGNMVFLRTSESGLNISEAPLLEATADENMYCILGPVLDTKSFFLNPEYYLLND